MSHPLDPPDDRAPTLPGARPDDDCAACDGCGLLGEGAAGMPRRAFLRDAAVVAAALVGALGPLSVEALTRDLARIAPLRADAQVLTFPVPAADGAQIDRDNQVILVRWEGAVYAFSLACPHQNTALRWYDADRRFQCPKHKSRYRPDGSFIEGRATRGMDRFAIAKEGETVRVDLDRLYRQDRDREAWDGAVVRI